MARIVPPPSAYSIEILLQEGFSVWAIRNYIRTGVLPRAHGRGRTAWYDDQHIAILRKIKAEKDSRRSLSEIAAEAHKTYKHANFAPKKAEPNE